MAEIVYKEGCEGQNRLNAIEGIKIEFDGGETLIFPKYAKHVILNKNFDLADWDSDEMTIEEAMEARRMRNFTESIVRQKYLSVSFRHSNGA